MHKFSASSEMCLYRQELTRWSIDTGATEWWTLRPIRTILGVYKRSFSSWIPENSQKCRILNVGNTSQKGQKMLLIKIFRTNTHKLERGKRRKQQKLCKLCNRNSKNRSMHANFVINIALRGQHMVAKGNHGDNH